MIDPPKRIWATGTTTSGSWNDAPLTMRSPPPQTEYHRTDLSADLVRAGYLAGLEVAAMHFQQQGEAMQERLNGRGYGNLPVNETKQIIADLFRDAMMIRSLTQNPEAIAAIVARVTEGK